MNFISGIISLTVGIVMISGVVVRVVSDTPHCTQITGTAAYSCDPLVNATGWSAAEIALFGLISLVSIAGIVYGAANVFGLA